MKKIIYAMAAVAVITTVAYCALVTLVNNPAISYDQTFTINLNTTPTPQGMHNNISAQAIYSSSTYATKTFTDGSTGSGSVTVSSVSDLTSAKATNQITFAATSDLNASKATNFLTVLSTSSLTNATITYNGNPLRNGRDWFSTSTTSGTAASLTTALNKFSSVRASRVNSVIFTTAAVAGAQGNNLTFASSTSSITVNSANFTGGKNSALLNAYVTINGKRYRQGFEWYQQPTSSGTARNLATVINRITGLDASAVGSVIYSTAATVGSTQNTYTMVSSTPTVMTVANPTFTGGRPAASVTINGYAVTQGTEWTAVATTTGTAQAITDAINAKTGLNSLVTASRSNSIVNIVSDSVGTASNYMLTTSTPTALVPSGPALTGGTAAAFTINTPSITIPSHGYGTGTAVVFTTGTVPISGLTTGSTYYVNAVDANTVKLATSKNNSIAGPYVTLASSSTTGPHTYTLTPAAISGTAGFFWEVSNDNVSYNPINVSSVTFSSPYTATSTQWDLGDIPQKYLRLNVTAPTTGGINLKVILNGSSN